MSKSVAQCEVCATPFGPEAAYCANCGAPANLHLSERLILANPKANTKRSGTASWQDMKRLFLFYGLLVLCIFIFGVITSFRPGPQINIIFSVFWTLIVTGFVFVEWGRVSRVFKFKVPKLRISLELFGVTLLVFLFLSAYFYVFKAFDLPLLRATDSFTKAHWPIGSIVLLVCLEPAVVEEIAFRGIIQTKLTEILSSKEALIIQAALFSVLHLSPAIFVSHFVMGLLFGWARLRTGQIYFGMLLHFAWNSMAVLKELN